MSNCGTSKVAQRCLRRHSFAQDSLAIGRQRTAGGPACRLLAKGRELLVQCFGAAPEGTPAGAASPPVGTGLGAGCVQELCEGSNVPAPLRVLLSLTVGMGQRCLACPAWQKWRVKPRWCSCCCRRRKRSLAGGWEHQDLVLVRVRCEEAVTCRTAAVGGDVSCHKHSQMACLN